MTRLKKINAKMKSALGWLAPFCKLEEFSLLYKVAEALASEVTKIGGLWPAKSGVRQLSFSFGRGPIISQTTVNSWHRVVNVPCWPTGSQPDFLGKMLHPIRVDLQVAKCQRKSDRRKIKASKQHVLSPSRLKSLSFPMDLFWTYSSS